MTFATPKHLLLAVPIAMLAVGCDVGSLFGGGRDKDSPTGTSAPPPGGGEIGTGRPAGASGRSAVPTQAEWGAVGEVTVKGSSALGCQTKMVREWLRVSCSGKNDTGGTPTTVSVTKGSSAERFTFAQNGVTSLVMPFLEGTDSEALFSWTDKAHKLVVQWPRGAPRPPVVGVFQGASSPLDPKACVDCRDEGDEVKAKAQGKACCSNPKCTTTAQCGAGKVCCVGPLGGNCYKNACDLGTATPVCSTDAECPSLGGQKLVCKPHPSGLKNCQSK